MCRSRLGFGSSPVVGPCYVSYSFSIQVAFSCPEQSCRSHFYRLNGIQLMPALGESPAWTFAGTSLCLWVQTGPLLKGPSSGLYSLPWTEIDLLSFICL